MSATVRALAVHDDGTGRKLYVAAPFAGGGSAISVWNGSNWAATALPAVGVSILALAVHDGGTGPRLHATTRSGTNPVTGVMRLDPTGWTGVGFTVVGPSTFAMPALISYTSGSAPGLYVGGGFEANQNAEAYLGRLGCPGR